MRAFLHKINVQDFMAYDGAKASDNFRFSKINEEFVVFVHLNVINVEMRLCDVCRTAVCLCALCIERREEPLTSSSTNRRHRQASYWNCRAT